MKVRRTRTDLTDGMKAVLRQLKRDEQVRPSLRGMAAWDECRALERRGLAEPGASWGYVLTAEGEAVKKLLGAGTPGGTHG